MGAQSVSFWLASASDIAKSFVVSSTQRTSTCKTSEPTHSELVTSGGFARNHSDLNRMFLRVTHGGGPKSLFESLDHPAFFHGGTHSGFYRDRRSYYLGKDDSLGKAWYLGEAWP